VKKKIQKIDFFSLQNFTRRGKRIHAFKERDKERERDALREEGERERAFFFEPFFFFYSLFRAEGRERKREKQRLFFFSNSLTHQENKKRMRAHAHHQSELLVIVRDARGVREEKPLRVHAKFDDEEKMTVRVDFFFFLLLCVFLFLRSFVRWRERLFNKSLTRERTRAYLTDIFALSLSLDVCFVQSNAKTESGESVDAPEMEPDVGFPANAVGDEEVVATGRRDVEVDRADGVGGGGGRRRRNGFRGVDDER